MKSLRLPFLDSTVVSAEVNLDSCPTLSDCGKILSYFYHTNMKVPIVIPIPDINSLIQYFSAEAKPGDAVWIRQISSLPFFENVVGNYLPIIPDRTYVWPSKGCNVGYNSWISGLNINFVKANGSWISLGSANQFKIHDSINQEQVYTKFIFPKFHLLSETKRYKHLDHIKRFVYPSAKNSDGHSEAIIAKLFIESLTILKCIGTVVSSLKPISAFCSHKVEILKIFSDDFCNCNLTNGFSSSRN